MAPRCTGLCDNEKSHTKHPYTNGYRRCSTCIKFIKTEQLRCFCCSTKLRRFAYKPACRKKRVVVRYWLTNMVIECKNKCRFEKKASKWTYRDGYKMCSVCVKSITDTPNHRCFCCNSVLRNGAQSNEYRQKRSAHCVRM